MSEDFVSALRADAMTRDNPWTRSVAGMLGMVVLLVVSIPCLISLPWTLGLTGSDVAPYKRQDLDAINQAPSWWTSEPRPAQTDSRLTVDDEAGGSRRHVLGTDNLGRDLFVRSLAGGGVSIGVGLCAAVISVLIGATYGAISGYFGGRIDGVMMRIVDVLYGLPYILLVVLLAVAVDSIIDSLGPERMSEGGHIAVNVFTLLVAIGGVSWLTMARVIRGQVLSLRNQPFMEAAQAMGIPLRRQFTRHLLPNLLGPIIVYATLTVPQAILQESFLSFLGIGIRPPLPSWGNLAAEGLKEMNTVEPHWWLLLFPSVLLAVTLLALNFVGEGLREAFDPRRART